MIVNGKNIVIGVGDTGLDVQSTFFYDAEHSVRYNTKKLDPNHRKVALYVPLMGDSEAVTAGHGTHVCGTIAGKANNNLYKSYNGLAYDARLLFVDLANDKDEMSTPTDLYADYFPYFYDQDVHISSNSWSSANIYTYNDRCRQVDKFVWEHNDMTILFSAGNDGAKGYNTVKSPSLSKNAISVGAVYSDYDFADGINYVTHFSSLANPNLKRIKPDVVADGVLVSAASLSPEDCGSDCKDHEGITHKEGTYPFQ